ncbi:MAG: hypothetical protein JOZ52_07455 [Acidobacteria bacterium]|nr:hypothetical protein [Acidobacteriota bacterium]
MALKTATGRKPSLSMSNEQSEIHRSTAAIKDTSYWWLFVTIGLAGILLISFGHWLQEHLSELLSKVTVDLGIGFVVAALVSAIFDSAFHRAVFGRPVQKIEEQVKNLFGQVQQNANALVETVSELNSILKSSYELKVNSIYKRQTDEEMSAWRAKVEKAVSEAEEFIYMGGKTLEELFPTRKDEKDQNISNTIKSKMQQERIKEVKIVLANAYDQDSPFRQECIVRRTTPSALWQPTRYTVEQIITLKAQINDTNTGNEKEKIHLRISTAPLPFVIVITEKVLIVQHYLPYVNGRHGVVMDITRAGDDTRNLYNIYKTSYQKFFDKAEDCRPIFIRYVTRKPYVKPMIRHILNHVGLSNSFDAE